MTVTWDPEKVLYAELVKRMKKMGVHPSSAIFVSMLQKMKEADSTFVVHFDQITFGTEIVPIEAGIEWFIEQLLATEDGIDSLVEGERVNRQSTLYNAAAETMRTSKGQLFSAEQIAARLKIDIGSTQRERRKQLRQLRRLLKRVCAAEGGYVKKVTKAEILFGFR